MVFADNQKEGYAVSYYRHLSIEERENLYLGINQGKSFAKSGCRSRFSTD